MADDAGLHSIHLGDHVLMGDDVSAYPYGKFKNSKETPWLEPLLTLAAMASVTSSLRLGVDALLAPMRSPALLAKSIATLDVLSGGRSEIAVGIGWQRVELEAGGVPWADRVAVFIDTIRACRALWCEQPATFTFGGVTFEDVWALPRPVQDRVPLLFARRIDPATADVIAELGDGWSPLGLSCDQIRSDVELLRDAYRRAGRDPSTIIVRGRASPDVLTSDGRIDVERTLQAATEATAAGVTVIVIGPPSGYDDMNQIRRLVDDIAKHAECL
jgi:probable F420-dependent oxidoreductase